MPRVSIIIPTSRTGPCLGACLESIAGQRFDMNEVEVHVVHNGVPRPADLPCGVWPFRLVQNRLEAPNISAAKNVALDAACGEWIIFINDDVLLEPGFLAAHLEAHARLGRPAMVVGLAAWKRYEDETVFDRMVQTTSMVFFYDRMQPHRWYGFRHAWNLNLSLKREWIGNERFCESVEPVLFDDVEFAFRLERRRGLRVWYAPEARCIHDHRYTLPQYLARERHLGGMAVKLWYADPDCFRAVYASDLDQGYLARAREWVERESSREHRLRSTLESLAVRPIADLGRDEQVRRDLIEALYQAHLPLKRLEFYRGLLKMHASYAPAREAAGSAVATCAAG